MTATPTDPMHHDAAPELAALDGGFADTLPPDTLPPDLSDASTVASVDIDLGWDDAPAPDAGVVLDLDVTDPGFTPVAVAATSAVSAFQTTQPLSAVATSETSARRLIDTSPPFSASEVPATGQDGWMDTVRRVRPLGADRRVLVVSADEEEHIYLRAKLALFGLVWVEDAATTTQALSVLATRPFAMAFVNMDSVTIDAAAIVNRLRLGNEAAALVLTSRSVTPSHPLDLLNRWRRARLARQLGQEQQAEVLAKPLAPQEVAALLSRLTRPQAG
jgi:hypothetical protein